MEGNENDERSPPVAVQTPPASPSSLKKHTVWSPTSAKVSWGARIGCIDPMETSCIDTIETSSK